MAPEQTAKEIAVSSEMKLSSVLNLAVFNGVGIVLAALVAEDQAWRLAYWRSMGFTPTTTYYPFFMSTSATNGLSSIPGLFTVDWLQVVLVVMAAVDALVVVGYLRRRSAAVEMTPVQKDR